MKYFELNQQQKFPSFMDLTLVHEFHQAIFVFFRGIWSFLLQAFCLVYLGLYHNQKMCNLVNCLNTQLYASDSILLTFLA